MPPATVATVVGGVAATALFCWPLAIWFAFTRLSMHDLHGSRFVAASDRIGACRFEVRKCEKPLYTVLKKLTAGSSFTPPVEVRRYAPHLIAEVTFPPDTPDMKAALSGGFRQIAKYIFNSEGGQNKAGKSEKISMTSPVKAEMVDGLYKVAFVMPRKYKTVADLPTPASSNVVIREEPARDLAVISWRGASPREAAVEEKKTELLALMAENGLELMPDAPTRVWQYYPPFAPNFLKLHEVLLPITME